MNLAIISDIHANFIALKTLSTDLEKADLVLCLGDFVGYYCQVNEVLDYVRGLNAICIRGNHDQFLVKGCPEELPASVRFGIEYADRVIDPDHRNWLSGLPITWANEISPGFQTLLFHGSPFEPLREYLYEDNPTLNFLDKFDFSALIFGHTHRFMNRSDKRPVLLNPGSVGQSREVETRAHASAILLNTDTLVVQRLLYPYDAQKVIDIARQNHAGDWVQKHLV